VSAIACLKHHVMGSSCNSRCFAARFKNREQANV